jgi:hypothetical protein
MRRPGDAPGRRPKQEQFFFEKKNQKTFATGAAHGWGRMRHVPGALAEVFCFFFSKKKAFPYFCRLPRHNA